jgi:hypothetical protein
LPLLPAGLPQWGWGVLVDKDGVVDGDGAIASHSYIYIILYLFK